VKLVESSELRNIVRREFGILEAGILQSVELFRLKGAHREKLLIQGIFIITYRV